MQKKKKSIWVPIFWLYIVVLFLLVVIKFNGSITVLMDRINSSMTNRANGIWNVNLIPFKSIETQLKHITQWWALKNIIGNIVPFLPLGFLLPMAYKSYHKLWKASSLLLAVIVGIEMFQLITMVGAFDVDDIILNFAGAVIGYLTFSVLRQYAMKERK